ncbi:hypothetical protein THTE_1898 [Thermogutta terrifontis]|uniref:Uncharacterized protein n=1 Tax=Thermogutta terrifontis TaxID=1331910 RepID=A0A286REW1_9BACT|nr:hypothetical protein THTE_1898 [Thermogutta terrifontis]
MSSHTRLIFGDDSFNRLAGRPTLNSRDLVLYFTRISRPNLFILL